MDSEAKLLVGPRVLADGSLATSRASRTLAQVVSDAHGKFHEAASRRRVFSVSTAVGGTTVVAGNNSPVAAAAATILTLYNPADSGVDLSILKAVLNFISGTPGAGAFVYNVHSGAIGTAAITAIENAAAVCNYASGIRSKAKGFTQTALTGGPAGALLRVIAGLFAGAIAASSPVNLVDLVDGEIVIPPGAALTIASPATGTSLILAASIVFEEVDRPN